MAMKTTKQVDPSHWIQLTLEQVCQNLSTDPQNGLDADEAQKRLHQFGLNQLPEQKPPSACKLFLSQFSNLMIWILVAAALIAGILSDVVDAAAIFVIVILNALLGFFHEFRAERALTALRKMINPFSKVIRSGKLQTIPSKMIVPGDLVVFESGDHIPADGRIIRSIDLMTQESALTGESMPIHKNSSVINQQTLPMAEQRNMCFMGTSAVKGKGAFIATGTGINTEIGKIALLLKDHLNEKTPLEIRLKKLSYFLIGISLGIVSAVFLLGFFRGTPLIENLLVSISLAVAAIPEGLPAIITITLAVGVHQMAQRKALIRRLPAVEVLGCTTVICTDKTGTLTQNKMVVRKVWVNHQFILVSGSGYIPKGDFTTNHTVIDAKADHELMLAIKIGALCNSAELHHSSVEESTWEISGDPTEGALLVLAEKTGQEKPDLELHYPFIDEIPFDSDRKKMSVIREGPQGVILLIKGAPDVVLHQSKFISLNGAVIPLNEENKNLALEANSLLCDQAYRVLAMAYRPLPAEYSMDSTIETDLIFVGLVAMMDLPRPEVKTSIAMSKRAGIKPVMITGDHQGTAAAVAREIGLMDKDSKLITGEDLDRMGEEEFLNAVKSISVYARTSAAHKLRIVRAWKSHGDIVAMTGDGINDAPAMNEADIGIAMGITGTDVTKETSDMIILDDNFATIVKAIAEGRGIYDNIIKFVSYLLTSNIAELLVIFLAMAVGLTDSLGNYVIPLSAIQILWINLVSDGLPAIALGIDPIDPRVMDRRPRKPSASLFTSFINGKLMLISLVTALASLAACYYGLRQSPQIAQTMTFTTLVLLELMIVQFVRAKYHLKFFSNPLLIFAIAGSGLLQMLLIYLPFLQQIFGTSPLSLYDWSLLLSIALCFGIFLFLVHRFPHKDKQVKHFLKRL